MILCKEISIILAAMDANWDIQTAFIELLRIIIQKNLAVKFSDFNCFCNFCLKIPGPSRPKIIILGMTRTGLLVNPFFK